MAENKEARRELLLRNRDHIKNVFSWDSGMMHLCCANIYTMRGLEVNEENLRNAKKMLESQVGAFSNFQSTARDVLVAMLDISGHPETLLKRALDMYDLLKQEFFTSSYLPVVAMMLAEQADPSYDRELVARTRVIYERMRKEHPMLTSAEDCALCVLLAMTDQTDDELIERMETGYRTLKEHFVFYGDALQSLTHVMALQPGEVPAACEKVVALISALKEAGHKWSSGYELPVLGILAQDPRGIDALVAEIIENDDWLKDQKGFGFFSSVSRMQRLMYAALLTQEDADVTATAAVNSTISSIIAQEVAMVAIVSASVAASASSSH